MIDTEKDTKKQVERALLVGFRNSDCPEATALEHLDELAELVKTLGIGVGGSVCAVVKEPSAEFYVGSGKAAEIIDTMHRLECDSLIFNTPLSPSQQRNWERKAKVCVVDREEIIIDIFASRAITREAVLQVELARMKYYLPRLARAWTHLSRQRGGAKGTRGEGETQIEVDRRMIKREISQLTKELEEVRKQRSTQRKLRERNSILHCAIVGYTNVGKSSILRALSGAGVLVEDKLFATLDPTTRKITLPNNQKLLLTDTVGFVRDLPHDLVEAFKSTLEEAVLSDFLMLVLDISSPIIFEQWETTLQVLHELGAEDKNILVVLNKIDKINENDEIFAVAKSRLVASDGVYISTKTGKNMDQLVKRLSEIVDERLESLKIQLPPSRHDLVAFARKQGAIRSEEYDEFGNLTLEINISKQYFHKFEPFILEKTS
ncbi:MAG: GTPase HflX [Lentisphaeria bacterium]|nr:GTPase HflX [Lentisphaeria bacterium]